MTSVRGFRTGWASSSFAPSDDRLDRETRNTGGSSSPRTRPAIADPHSTTGAAAFGTLVASCAHGAHNTASGEWEAAAVVLGALSATSSFGYPR